MSVLRTLPQLLSQDSAQHQDDFHLHVAGKIGILATLIFDEEEAIPGVGPGNAPAAEPPPYGPGSSFDLAIPNPRSLTHPQNDVVDALIAGVVRIKRRAEIYESDGETPFDIPDWDARLVEGTVTVDRERAERRMVELTFENEDNALQLNPGEGFGYDKIIKTFWGIKYFDSNGFPRIYDVQIGEFMIDRIVEPRFPHVTKVMGRDYAKKCLSSKLPFSMYFPAGTPIEDMIRALAANAGIKKFALPVTGQAYNLDRTFDRGTERWTVMKAVADSIGYEVYFRGDGYLTMRPYPDPTYSPLTWIFRGGKVDGTLINYERMSDDTRIKNHIIVVGGSSTDPSGLTTGIFAEARNDDPASPTRIDNIGDRVEIIESDYFDNVQVAQAFANSRLKIAALETFEVNFESLIIPWLDGGDIVDIDVSHGSAYVPSRFLLSNFNLPLGLGSMTGVGKRVIISGTNQLLEYQ